MQIELPKLTTKLGQHQILTWLNFDSKTKKYNFMSLKSDPKFQANILTCSAIQSESLESDQVNDYCMNLFHSYAVKHYKKKLKKIKNN